MGLAAVVALGSAAIAPAHKDRDEPNQTMAQPSAARPVGVGGAAGAGYACGGLDCQHGGIGTAVQSRPDVGFERYAHGLAGWHWASVMVQPSADDLTAALWLTGPVMYVQPVPREHLAVSNNAITELPPSDVSTPMLIPRGGAVAEFFRGYDAAGGAVAYRDHLIDVLQCESGWADNRSGGYYSAAQFAPSSWERAGGGDPSDFYVVGRNVGNWINLISDPGGSGGWPVCWHVNGW